MRKNYIKLSSYAIDFLTKYSFPGNVRELENLIERNVALSFTNIILPESLTISIHKKRRWIEGIKGQRFDLEEVEQGVDLDKIFATIESSYLTKALVKNKAGTYCAKFSKLSDKYHVAPIETAIFQLAQDACLRKVSDFLIQNAGTRKVLI